MKRTEVYERGYGYTAKRNLGLIVECLANLEHNSDDTIVADLSKVCLRQDFDSNRDDNFYGMKMDSLK